MLVSCTNEQVCVIPALLSHTREQSVDTLYALPVSLSTKPWEAPTAVHQVRSYEPPHWTSVDATLLQKVAAGLGLLTAGAPGLQAVYTRVPAALDPLNRGQGIRPWAARAT